MNMQEAWEECKNSVEKHSLMGEYQEALAKEFFECGWINAHDSIRANVYEAQKKYSWVKDIED